MKLIMFLLHPRRILKVFAVLGVFIILLGLVVKSLNDNLYLSLFWLGFKILIISLILIIITLKPIMGYLINKIQKK